MKIIIFAGGSGTRFWPISREKLPKQFVKITNNSSTLSLAVQRVQPVYGWHNIYISTNEKYVSLVKSEVDQVPNSHIYTEPSKQDVGPAVGLSLIRMRKMGVKEPLFIGWADHLINNVSDFQQKLKTAEEWVMSGKHKIVFWGEKPKFANHNFGWINLEGESGFGGLIYRPEPKKCEQMYGQGNWFWNTGYFVSTVDYLLDIYQKHQPDLYNKLLQIEAALGTEKEEEVLQQVYPTIEPIHFDEAVVYNIKKEDGGVIVSDMGWEDPGTVYALKKYYEKGDENYIKGKGVLTSSVDSMVFNLEDKLVTGVGLKNTVVVNTKDAVLVVTKDSVGDIKKLLKELEKDNKLKKYL